MGNKVPISAKKVADHMCSSTERAERLASLAFYWAEIEGGGEICQND